MRCTVIKIFRNKFQYLYKHKMILILISYLQILIENCLMILTFFCILLNLGRAVVGQILCTSH